MTKQVVKTTDEIRRQLKFVVVLQDNLGAVMSQPLWRHRVPIEDKIKYLAQLSDARSKLYDMTARLCHRDGEFTVGDAIITFEEPEQEGSVQ